MNKQRLYTRLERIGDSIHDLECKMESCLCAREKKQYDKKKGETVFYASKNKKKIKGVDKKRKK